MKPSKPKLLVKMGKYPQGKGTSHFPLELSLTILSAIRGFNKIETYIYPMLVFCYVQQGGIYKHPNLSLLKIEMFYLTIFLFMYVFVICKVLEGGIILFYFLLYPQGLRIASST